MALFEWIALVNGLGILFLSILWVLATRDRKRIVMLLEAYLKERDKNSNLED